MARSMTSVLAACALFAALAPAQPLVTGPVVVFLGPPGSGKSTQARAAAKYLKVPIVSAEELITDNAAELAKARTPGIAGMEPQTDPLLNKFFEARLKKGDLKDGVVLDGYPNTKDHADFASKLVVQGVIPKAVILHLQIPDDVVRKRLAGKGGKLSAAAEQRLKDYHRETTAIQVYFPNADITPIDGTKKPGKVEKQVREVLKAKFGK
jgi:adenylate kinase